MNRAMLEDHLTQAERHVVKGLEYVARQRELVGRLERDGHDIGRASALLVQFEELQAMHVADRDRLRCELGLRSRGI